MATLSEKEFDKLSEYIYNVSGISLDSNKEYLIETRLNPILDKWDCNSFSDLLQKAKQDSTGELEKHIISAISTNETLFFRDEKPFNLLENKIIPDLIDKRSKTHSGKIPLKIWSAGCSYGQEVYSIIITLLEMLSDPNKYEIDVLGTDISNNAIERASYGKYSKFEIERGLPDSYRRKYFHKHENKWRINDRVRMHARFKIVNLMKPFNNLGPFDIIFCRNVAIYFSHGDKHHLFKNLSKVLKQDGYLILGGSENLTNLSTPFTPQHYLRSIYYTLDDGKKESRTNKPESMSRSTGSSGKRRKSNIFKKVKRRRRKQDKKNKSYSNKTRSINNSDENKKKETKFSHSRSKDREHNTDSNVGKTSESRARAENSGLLTKTKEKVENKSNSDTKQKKKNILKEKNESEEENQATRRSSLLSSIKKRSNNSSEKNKPSERKSLLEQLEE